MDPYARKHPTTTSGVITLVLLMLLLLSGITSCAVKKRTVREVSASIKDTVYIERNRQTDKTVRDTLYIETVVTEYYPDTAGNWIPARRSITSGKETGIRVSSGSETEQTSAAKTTEKQETTLEETTQRSFSRWRWFLAGAATSFIMLLAAYMIKQTYFRRII